MEHKHKIKILIAEDNQSSRKLYKEELQDEGYDVVTASSGNEALQMFHEKKPDLITLDVLMPDLDGITLLRKMKEARPHVPIILLSAYDYRDDFSVWAGNAYIIKSADMTELKNAVKNLTPSAL
jgi:DNA-binding response OmpR family regulator